MSEQFPQGSEKLQKTGRVAATSVIWGVSAGMLAISIPLVIVTKTGAIIPLAAIVGAAVATFAVWSGENQNSQVKQLEERISFLETIVTGKDSDVTSK